MLRSAKEGTIIMTEYIGEAAGPNVATASKIFIISMTLHFRVLVSGGGGIKLQ